MRALTSCLVLLYNLSWLSPGLLRPEPVLSLLSLVRTPRPRPDRASLVLTLAVLLFGNERFTLQSASAAATVDKLPSHSSLATTSMTHKTAFPLDSMGRNPNNQTSKPGKGIIFFFGGGVVFL